MIEPIELRSASKWYGPVIGLNDVTLKIKPGVTGLLGPNGAGKTTLIRLVTGQAEPSAGEVLVFGEPVFRSPDVLARLGCCPDVEAIDEEATGFEFVRSYAWLSGFSRAAARQRADALLARVGMTEAAHRAIGSYSKGMRQRVKLAQALVLEPDILVLDEPLNGMDPLARRETIDFVRKLGQEGKTVLVSSHVLHEVEAMTDAIALMHHGRILAEGKVHEIRNLLKGYPHQIAIECADPHTVARRVMNSDHVVGLRFEDRELRIETRDAEALYRAIESLVLDEGLELARMSTRDDSLEAVFDYLVR
ncbi:MAG: ABC transporter ATP-binding protein [Planctomycetes bacterium]|nr:ABC transporter ATP-binding protein [Planctomycetota bacterium]